MIQSVVFFVVAACVDWDSIISNFIFIIIYEMENTVTPFHRCGNEAHGAEVFQIAQAMCARVPPSGICRPSFCCNPPPQSRLPACNCLTNACPALEDRPLGGQRWCSRSCSNHLQYLLCPSLPPPPPFPWAGFESP